MKKYFYFLTFLVFLNACSYDLERNISSFKKTDNPTTDNNNQPVTLEQSIYSGDVSFVIYDENTSSQASFLQQAFRAVFINTPSIVLTYKAIDDENLLLLSTVRNSLNITTNTFYTTKSELIENNPSICNPAICIKLATLQVINLSDGKEIKGAVVKSKTTDLTQKPDSMFAIHSANNEENNDPSSYNLKIYAAQNPEIYLGIIGSSVITCKIDAQTSEFTIDRQQGYQVFKKEDPTKKFKIQFNTNLLEGNIVFDIDKLKLFLESSNSTINVTEVPSSSTNLNYSYCKTAMTDLGPPSADELKLMAINQNLTINSQNIEDSTVVVPVNVTIGTNLITMSPFKPKLTKTQQENLLTTKTKILSKAKVSATTAKTDVDDQTLVAISVTASVGDVTSSEESSFVIGSESLNLKAEGTYKSGKKRDLTGKVKWNYPDSSGIVIDSNGKILESNIGMSKITASLSKITSPSISIKAKKEVKIKLNIQNLK